MGLLPEGWMVWSGLRWITAGDLSASRGRLRGMATDLGPCHVLRCGGRAVGSFVAHDHPGLTTFGVCAEHDASLRSGGPWRVERGEDWSQTLLCHPDDLAGDGSRVVRGDISLRGVPLSSEPAHSRLCMDVSPWGRADRDAVQLWMTREQLIDLRGLLNNVFTDPS